MAGLLHVQRGNVDEGIALLKRAAVLNPGSFEAHANLGIALRAKGEYESALEHIDRALALSQPQPALLAIRGTVLGALRRNTEALSAYDAALAIAPDDSETHYQRGLVLHAMGQPADALASFNRALAGANDPEIHYNRGVVLQSLGKSEEALAAYGHALALNPNLAAALNNGGNLLVDMGRADEGEAWMRRCLVQSPDFAEAHNNLALALMAQERHAEALESLGRALQLDASYVEAHLNKATAMLDIGRPDDALASLQRAEQLAPESAKVHHNFGIVFHALNRLDEAVSHYRRAIDLQPGYPEALFHMSLTELLLGDFAAGWKNYELRWRVRNAASPRIPTPPWSGDIPVEGKRILLWCEQGLGDTVQFCRYAPLLAARGARVILEVPATLATLAKSLSGVETQLIQGGTLPDFDLHCPLLSLPLAMGTDLGSIPAQVPYLTAEPKKISEWAERLSVSQGLRIGFVASGNPKHKNDRNRSLPLASLAPLIRQGVACYLLQQECRAADEEYLEATPAIMDLRPWLTDFSETAAAIACMDLIISVDTSVAHLAGALGKPVWILLPYNPDWRWLLGRDDSPWYPGTRLFRQPAIGDWDTVVASVGTALQALTAPC